MSLLALALALLLARIRPRADDPLHAGVCRLGVWAEALVRRLPVGLPSWGPGAVVALVLLAALVLLESVLSHWPTVLVLALHVAVLYFALDFGLVGDALRSSRLLPPGIGARGVDGEVSDAGSSATAGARAAAGEGMAGDAFRASIEGLLLGAHRRLLAPVLAYVLAPGVIGLLFYAVLEQFVRQREVARDHPPAFDDAAPASASEARDAGDRAGGVAGMIGRGEESVDSTAVGGLQAEVLDDVYRWTDWVPLRTTAALFAIAGNFEDAAYCWRGAASAPVADVQRAMLLAVGGGALGVRLADAALAARWREAAAFEWQAEEPDAEAVHGASGLVSRSAAILGALILLVTLAGW